MTQEEFVRMNDRRIALINKDVDTAGLLTNEERFELETLEGNLATFVESLCLVKWREDLVKGDGNEG